MSTAKKWMDLRVEIHKNKGVPEKVASNPGCCPLFRDADGKAPTNQTFYHGKLNHNHSEDSSTKLPNMRW